MLLNPNYWTDRSAVGNTPPLFRVCGSVYINYFVFLITQSCTNSLFSAGTRWSCDSSYPVVLHRWVMVDTNDTNTNDTNTNDTTQTHTHTHIQWNPDPTCDCTECLCIAEAVPECSARTRNTTWRDMWHNNCFTSIIFYFLLLHWTRRRK